MEADESIEAIERQIDESFEASDLIDVGYEQAVWTLLSTNEDAYLKYLKTLPDEAVHVVIDNRMNALTYPLRACLKRCQLLGRGIRRELINVDYEAAWKWLESAEKYSQFCSIFPLWYRGRIKLSALENRLIVESVFNNDKTYEAYNRLIKKEGRSDADINPPDDNLLRLLLSNLTAGDTWFRVNFDIALVSGLVSALEPSMVDRHTLPENYLTLVDKKEITVVEEIKEFLAPMNLEFEAGAVKGTDVDLAIIDRSNKVCLCLELKWFIEPAEIREIEDRTKELLRSVVQARKIDALFQAADNHLLQNVLKIDSNYTFLSVVGSVNWIGFGDVQDSAIPIIKVWHLLNFLKDKGSLSDAVIWLKSRRYLPRAGSDYSVEPWEVSCGKWSATWYGVKPLK